MTGGNSFSCIGDPDWQRGLRRQRVPGLEQERAAGRRRDYRYGFHSAGRGRHRLPDHSGQEPLVNLDALDGLGFRHRRRRHSERLVGHRRPRRALAAPPRNDADGHRALPIRRRATEGNCGNPIDTGDSRLLDAVFRDGHCGRRGTTTCKPTGDDYDRTQLPAILRGADRRRQPVLNQDFSFGTKNFYDYYPSVDLDSSDDLITSFTPIVVDRIPVGLRRWAPGRRSGRHARNAGALSGRGAGYNSNESRGVTQTLSDGATILAPASIQPIKPRFGLRRNTGHGATTGLELGNMDRRGARHRAPPHADRDRDPDADCDGHCHNDRDRDRLRDSATPTTSATPTASHSPTATASGTPTLRRQLRLHRHSHPNRVQRRRDRDRN